MIKVLFICHGNICRSPMAQYVFADMVKKQGMGYLFEIDSAATSREEIGNGVHHGTRRKLAEMGIPCGDHHARRNLMRILGSDPEHKVHGLLDFSRRPRDIADPWYTGNFDVTYEDIAEGCTDFLQHVMK